MKNKINSRSIVSSILLILLILILLVIVWTWENPVNIKLPIDYIAFGTYGDFFGGVIGTLFAIIGVVIVYYTFIDQSDFQEKEQIESRFFELLNLHEKNVEELKKIDEKIFSIYIKNISNFVTIIQEYNKIESKSWDDSTIVKLGYLYFFYGASDYTSERLKRVNVESDDVKALNNYINNLGINYKGSFEDFGKYFRQLFQIVTYIDSKSILTYAKKGEYTKSLRVRLNIEEQYLLFLNSLVSTGLDWEKGKAEVKDQLITKYNLLKNIPKEYNPIEGISLLNEYPNIHYEFLGDIKSDVRLRLEETYNTKINHSGSPLIKLSEKLKMRFNSIKKHAKLK